MKLTCGLTINPRFFGFAAGEIDFPLRKIKEKPDVQRRSFPALNFTTCKYSTFISRQPVREQPFSFANAI